MNTETVKSSGRGIAGKIRFDQLTIVFAILVVLFVLFSATLPGFFTIGNMVNVVRSVSVLGILGLGMAVVVIGRGIDFSMVALLAVPTALSMTLAGYDAPIALALLAGFALALAVGLLNGYMVAYAEVHSLLVTLATGLGLAGLGQTDLLEFDLVSWPSQLDPIVWVGSSDLYGIPSPIIAFAIVAICVALFLRRTKLGRFIYAVGDNPEGARTAGIPVRPIIVLQFLIAAFIAVIAGLVMASSSGVMDTRIYNATLIYNVILVVVLGGVGLSGGRGGVINVIVGAMLVGVILNSMTILNFSFDMQNLIKGVILIVAIGIDSLLNPRNEETAQQGDI